MRYGHKECATEYYFSILDLMSSDTEKGNNPMSFKFLVGQTVGYTPIGEKEACSFTIVRQMPREDQAFDLCYRIKSETDAHERNVLECHLSPM
jgi:hypothetical protein